MTRIGITGHTALTVETRALVYEAISAALEVHRGRGLRGVTCLADGADQIFARAVLAAEGSFEVVLPASDYRERVVSRANRADFDDLLSRATKVSYMPFPLANRVAYMQASEELLRRCDLLIAVWDGQPSQRLGDAAHVVNTARRRGLPVVVCWPAGACRLAPQPDSERRLDGERQPDGPNRQDAGAVALRPRLYTERQAALMPRTGMHLAASGSRRGQPRRPDLPQDRAAGSSEERVLFFFLSYARGDDDIYVNKFYHDLCGEIRVRTGMGRDREVGFLDTHSIEIGAPWSSKLIDALSRCRAFLALCSPAYFLSDACGKEWKIFADRMRLYEETTGVQPPALIPLVWFPPPRMPPVAEAIQYHTDVLGDAYNRDGLRQLIRLQRHRDAYLEFVSAVAEQVVSTAYTHTVPERRTHVEFHHVPNVFQADPGLSPAPHLEGGIPMDAESGPGVQYVHFVIASASRAEINPVRRSLEFYGVTAQDWAPYRPALSSSLGEYACRIAAERSFQSGVAGVEGLANRLDEARRNNQVVVLLVDVWTTRLDEHRNALVEYDQRHEPTTAVMIPWSHDDQETQQHWSELADSLRRIFMNNLIRRDDVMFRSSVLTPDAFSADLQVVLEVAKNRIFVKGTVYRRPPGELTSGRPILEGP